MPVSNRTSEFPQNSFGWMFPKLYILEEKKKNKNVVKPLGKLVFAEISSVFTKLSLIYASKCDPLA
jgi:hypothetical protein